MSLTTATQVFEWLSLVFVSVLLLPQLLHNYRRQSTQGMSTLMMLSWLISAEIIATYLLYTHQPLGTVLAWFVFSFFNILILLQVHYYNRYVITNKTVLQRRVLFFIWFLVSLAGSTLFSYLQCLLFYWSSLSGGFQWIESLWGGWLPTVLFIVGFVPQFYELFKHHSSEGLSLGLIVLDISACSFSIAAIVSSAADKRQSVDVAAIAPTSSIIVFELLMLFIMFVIFPKHNLSKI